MLRLPTPHWWTSFRNSILQAPIVEFYTCHSRRIQIGPYRWIKIKIKFLRDWPLFQDLPRRESTRSRVKADIEIWKQLVAQRRSLNKLYIIYFIKCKSYLLAVMKCYPLYVFQYWPLISEKNFNFDDGYLSCAPSLWHCLFSPGWHLIFCTEDSFTIGWLGLRASSGNIQRKYTLLNTLNNQFVTLLTGHWRNLDNTTTSRIFATQHLHLEICASLLLQHQLVEYLTMDPMLWHVFRLYQPGQHFQMHGL